MPVFFVWRLFERLRSCDGLKLVSLELIYSFKTKPLITLRCADQRCDQLMMCSPLVLHALTLYRTWLYFLPSLFIKSNLPNFRNIFLSNSSYRLDFCTTGKTIHFRYTIFLWIHPSSQKKAKNLCSGLFDVLQYLYVHQTILDK